MGVVKKINFILNSPNSSPQRKARYCTTKSEKVVKRKRESRVAPEGCFTVYVGSEKQRFVIKAKWANHPLFQMLLEDAELEYGYCSEGPILIRCDVDLFNKVLAEMDSDCSIAHGSCSPSSPSLRFGSNVAKGYGSYNLLPSSPLLKMNQY